MRADYTDITVLLDRSGSMGMLVDAMIEGYNSMLREQQEQPGYGTITLVQFDDKYEPEPTVPLRSAKLLDRNRYSPRGYTALNDSLGRTIVATGERLRRLPESERPAKVIFLVMTDGMNNCYTGYTREQVRDMIRHQERKYGWKFLYVGANQDAIVEGESMGLQADYAVDYDATPRSTLRTYNLCSSKMSAYRTSGDNKTLQFTQEERAELKS